jgi:hypothetical protein
MVRIKSRRLYPERKGPSSGFSLNSKLDGLEVRSGLFGEDKLSLSVPRNEPRSGLTTNTVLKVITNFQAVLGGPSCIEKLAPCLFDTSVRNACPDLFVGL